MKGRIALAAVAIAALSLGACSSDDDGGAVSDGDGASTSIEATATEFMFDPVSWTVPAGEEVTIDFNNEGTVDHEWVVIKLGDELDSEADFAEEKVEYEVEAGSGETHSDTFTIDEAGTYQVICGLEGHFDAGMEGTLTVA